MCALADDGRLEQAVAAPSSASLGLVLGVIIAVLILLLIAVDTSCYFINGCGALATICSHFCGRGPASKRKTVEERDR